MTPDNGRDTFITLQATQGHSSTKIAHWVGNSSKVIEEKYLDVLKLEHLRLADIQEKYLQNSGGLSITKRLEEIASFLTIQAIPKALCWLWQ